ncbi:TPA: endoribonuclease MazF [bacterium]|nr:endoribonuclease MazF [bacterium]
MSRGYVPERGDIVWLDMNPQVGREESGRRPAVVISPATYNGKHGLGLFCPVTSHIKGYPFEVVLPDYEDVHGAVLTDQLKSLDWRVRHVKFIKKMTRESMSEILAKLATLVT